MAVQLPAPVWWWAYVGIIFFQLGLESLLLGYLHWKEMLWKNSEFNEFLLTMNYVYFWTFPQAEIKMHYLRPRGRGRCSRRGDYPENNLAKFGYILDMKVGKRIKQNPSIFLATYWILTLKSGDLKKKFLWNLANLGHFFHEIVFTYSTSLCLDHQKRLRKSSKT